MRKFLTVVGIVVFVVLMVWMILAKPKRSAPDVESAEPVEVVAYLASEDFGKLSEAKQVEFMTRLRELPSEKRAELFRAAASEMGPKTRQTLRANFIRAMHAQLLREARVFLELNPAEQLAHLDARIDEMEAHRRDAPWRRGGKIDPDEVQKFIQKRISGSTPEDRAIMSEYFKRLHQRRQERQKSG